jgi:hypothetical protein
MPAHTREAVLAALAAAFPADLDALLSELDRYGLEPYEQEKERVQLAIIELSAGNADKLREFVRIAKTDYRDILAWQELGPLSEAEGRKLQDAARALIGKWGRK